MLDYSHLEATRGHDGNSSGMVSTPDGSPEKKIKKKCLTNENKKCYNTSVARRWTESHKDRGKRGAAKEH